MEKFVSACNDKASGVNSVTSLYAAACAERPDVERPRRPHYKKRTGITIPETLLKDELVDFFRNSELDDSLIVSELRALRAVYKNDDDVVLAAVTNNGLALQHASERLKRYHDIVLAAVRQNGLALQYASGDMKDNIDIVRIAVRQNGLALQYASDSLIVHVLAEPEILDVHFP